MLGSGQQGKVYLATEQVASDKPESTLGGSHGADITASKKHLTEFTRYCACKVVERRGLSRSNESLIVSEI
jgi:serine/threonine protein kinase